MTQTHGVYDGLSCFVASGHLDARSMSGLDFNSPEFWESMEANFSSDAGEKVTHRKALGYAPVYQAVSKISGDVAKLPLNVYRRVESGKEIDKSHPAYPIIQLMGKANQDCSSFKFWRRLMANALLWGNGWAWIERDGSGRPIGLYHLLSDRTSYDRNRGQMVVLTEVGGKLWELHPDDVIHIEGVSIDGEQGEDILRLFRHDFGLALAARKFTSNFFNNGANLGGVLMVPRESKPEAVRKVQAGLEEKFSTTSKAFKTLVLRDGFRWVSTQVDPSKASVGELDEAATRKVANMFNLDPSHLGIKGSVSYNSREMAKQDYHDSTLSHWLIGVKSECNLKLLSDRERQTDSHTIDYNVNALMWTDAKTRSEIASRGIQTGRYSPNETRAWENMNPYDGGDVWYQPLHLATVGKDADDEYEEDPDADPQTDDQDTDDSQTDDSRSQLKPVKRRGKPQPKPQPDLIARLLTETITRIHGRLHGQARKHDAFITNLYANQDTCRDMLATPAAIAGLDVETILQAYAARFANGTVYWDEVRDSIPDLVKELMQ